MVPLKMFTYFLQNSTIFYLRKGGGGRRTETFTKGQLQGHCPPCRGSTHISFNPFYSSKKQLPALYELYEACLEAAFAK